MKCSRSTRAIGAVVLAVIGLSACGRTASPPRPVITATTPARDPGIVPAPLSVEAAQGPGFIILSPADKVYLDMKYDHATPIGLTWAGRIEVRDAYDWDPSTALAGVPESAVLGVEAPLWSETIANVRDVEYLAFPRIAAVAEIGWSWAHRRSWESFRERLGAQAPRWTALGVNFYRSPQIPWKD
jgi:hexosaminidase